MANLGTLTTKSSGEKIKSAYVVASWPSGTTLTVGFDHRAQPRVVAYWAISPTTNRNGIDIDVSGSITGNVKEGATNIAYCWVHLYYRPTGERITSIKTDINGNFTLSGLQVGQQLYYAIALDPDGGTQYNALIYDRVTPE